MAGQGITVPISLQISNLQAIINEIQSKMSNLKVGSGGFRALETSLKYLQKELDSLQVQAQKPFMTENQFSSAQKSVTRLEDEFNNLQLKVNRIKFSDLNLNPDQQAQLKALQDEVVAIQNSLKSLKETAKQEFLGSDLGKIWKEIDPTASTKSLDQITSNIRRAVLDQKELADQAKEAWQDYAKATSLSDTVEKALKTKNPLENLMSSNEYNSFFSENKNGVLSFKSGQKPVFEQWLIDNLQVDPNIAHNLVQQSANQIREELKNAQSAIRAELNTKIKPTARTDESTAKTDYDKQSASLLQLQDILNRVAAAYLNIDTNSADLKQRLAENGISADKLRESFVQAAQAELSLGNNAKTVNTNLATLKTTLDSTNASFLRQQRVTQSFNSMKMAVVNFMGFNQVLNITRRAVREAINHIKELDTVMNGIAIVTDMSTGDLWTQIDQYSKMAQAYGVSITGAYEVSQIYYQQGLETADVMTLTNETLKLAKISGLDYATTTDYMTTAIRGFKMEMSEASTVVDVYSNLAAHTAVSQEELAVAMSKTASSMEGVGATFEEASAMIGTMVAVTRESATNIGSAMKSIASRYGELTKDPTKLVDEEGEAMAFNKVDAALQSVGISMRTVDGQFREFTDVIVELGEKWDQLDSTQQRYIATQFAGNRQQSRFLALVGNVDLLKSNLDVAMNSEDTGTLQALKALDSIESKIEQVKVAYQQFYTTIGVESVWKGLLDSTKEVINTLNGLPKLFGKIPVGAIAVVYDIINLIKGALTHGLTAVADIVINHLQNTTNEVENAGNKMRPAGENFFDKFIAGMTSKYGALKEAARKGVDEANQAAREQRQYQILDQKYKNDEQIKTNEALLGQNITRQTELRTAIKSEDTAYQTQRFNDLGVSASNAAAELQRLEQEQKNLEQANEDLRAKNKELEDSFNAESNAENNNADSKNRNVLATKNGISAALKLAASQHQLSASTSAIASGLNMVATMIGTSSRAAQVASGAFMMFGGALRGFGAIFEYIKNLGTSAQTAFPWMAAIMAGISLINGISQMWETDEERIERLTKEAEDLNNAVKEAKANYKTLDNSIKKLDELREKRYESAEAAEEYQTQVDELADKFPQMIAGFDAAGNVIIDTTNAEEILTEARKKSAQATYDAAKKELDVAKENREKARKSYESATGGLASALDNLDYSNTSGRYFETFNKSRYVGRDEHYHNIAADNWNLATQGSGENGKFTDTELLQNLKDLSGWSEQQGIDDFEFLWNFNYRDGTISELQQQMDKFAANTPNGDVSLEFRQIENLLQLQQQNAIDDAYTNVVKAANDLSTVGAEDKDYSNKVQAVNKAIEAYKTAVGGYAPEGIINAFSELEDSVNAMNSAEQEFISMTRIYEGNKKAVVGAWQQSAKGNQEAWDTLQKSSFASMLATETIVSQIDDKFNGNYEAWEKDAIAQKAAKDTQENYAKTLNSILKDEEQLKQFEQMGFDTNNYTGQDIIDAFQIKDKDLIDAINKHYSEGIISRQNRLQSQLAAALGKPSDTEGNYDLAELESENKESWAQFYKDYYDLTKANLTGNEEKVLNSMLEEYQKLSSEGYFQQAETYGDNAIQIFNEIAKAPYDIQKTLWNLILENGIDTKTGLTKIMQTVSSNSELSQYLDTETLQQLIDNIITNVGLEIDMMLDDLLNNWEEESKTLNKALSGGLSSKEAAQFIEQAQNLGVQLGEGEEFNIDTAFNWDGKTLTLTAEAWNVYWKKLQEANDANVTAFQTDINNAQEILTNKEFDKTTLQNQYKDRLTEMGFTETDWENEDYWNEDQLTEAGQAYLQELINKRQLSLNEYKRYAQLEEDALTREHDRMNGIYKDATGQVITNIEQLKALAQNNTATGIDKVNKEALNETYDTLISDVLSKGLDNIHLEDYKGLVAADKMHLETYLNTNSYQEFINEYAKLAGKSIDETNELLAQAIEKQQEKTSSEVLSNLQFINQNQFAASLSDLTELANRFDVGLSDLTKNWSQALGAYIVDITEIDAFKNFTGVENYQAIINDSINEFFGDLVNLIKSALSGSLSNTDRGKLDQWVANYNEQFGTNLKLDFIKTADGLQLATNSAKELYNVMNQLDSIQGSVIFETLKDNLIETDERFKSAASNAAYIREIESRGLTSDQQSILQNLNGNVNLFDRPVLQNADGSITTLFAGTEDSRNYKSEIPWVMNITPVTPAGKELSSAELQKYIQELVEESSGNMDEMIKLDKSQLGLIIEGENTEIEQQEKILQVYDDRAEKLHEISDAIEQNKQKSAEELALAQKIAEARGLSQDDSFKFMEQAIPDAQNNPLNYWENWGKAYKAMNEASKTGKMDYSTFYNLVTEMGNLAKMTGKAIPLGEETVSNAETAAALIEKAAGALQIQADGSVQIDLSRIGVDFVSGADKMNANIEDGIHQVAQSQIEMLNSIIGLLETIVTMEDAFKQFNVDSDTDMKLDLDEIFDIEYNEDKSIKKINGFADNWENALNYLRDRLDPTKLDTYSEDLARGAESIKFAINGFEMSLADLIKTDFNDLSKYGFTSENLNIYQNIMQGVYDAIQSGDFTETNVKELIMQKLQNNLGDSGEIVFDMGNYTFIGSGGMQFSIDWDDNNTKAALNQLQGTLEQKQNQLIEANKARGKNKATPFQYQTTLIAEGAVKVEDGKGKVNIEGKEYSYDATHPEKITGLLGAAELDKLGAKGIEWHNNHPVAAKGTLKMGEREVKVEASDQGKINYVADDGTKYTSPRDLVDAEVDKEWKAKMEEKGISDEFSDAAQAIKKQVKYDIEVEYGISTFALNSQSYQGLNEQIQKDLEEALKSGNQAKIDAVIDANVELAELKGLSSSEIEEKLGIKEVKVKFEGDTEAATTALAGLKTTVEELTKEPIKLKAEEDPSISTAATTLQTLKDKLDAIDDTDPNISISTDETVSATQTALESISSELSKIADMKTQTIKITKSITTTETATPSADTKEPSDATGTVGLAKAQGTLMGELGPELIVSNGRYFVAGQNGPEFVDLASDAIVFNHLQTEQLLKHGMSSTRGQAVTNERNAVAFASGNINGGPALASAKAVLGQLKQLRSMWQSLLGSSVKDLAGAGGGGGGGGGGNDAAKDPAFVKDLEKWYNWLQRIAVLEEKINYEEAKRNKIASDMIAHGQDYAKSLLESFNYLKEQTAVHQSLADSQQVYFNQRREQMNSASNPFSALYTFDEYGQLKYKNGALAQLSEIISRDQLTGKGTYTASEQYAILKNNGFERYMQYDSSGNEIDRSQEGWETNAIQAFWDKIDADKEEMQSLHDSIEEHKKAVLEDQEKANEILKEIEDNQISVEDRVLKAIEDTRQREIDELQKQRDAIEESANNLINGLSEQLNREKDMYSQQASQDELTRLQRQLGILQNSGGSASQIASLQKEIGQKQQDAYFEAQQRQIDTLQQASQNELERLDRQIDLMTESLEYEKENGLLWGAVYEVMAGTPEQITSFITEHDSQYWGVSPTQLTQDTRDILFEAQQFVTYRQEMKDGITGMIDAFNSYKVETEKQLEDTRKLAMDASGANSESTEKNTGGGSGGGNPGGSNSNSKGTSTNTPKTIKAGDWVREGAKVVGATLAVENITKGAAAITNTVKNIMSTAKTATTSTANSIFNFLTGKKFAGGGLATETGLSWLDGSKSHPEAVLTAEQTATLRNDILSNKPTSLLNLLTDFRDAYGSIAGANSYGTINNNAGVTIEQATVEMHVAQIANDYDASRAGEQVLEKIMAIARKSQGSTRIGR